MALKSNARVIIADLKLSPGCEELVRDNDNVRFSKCDVTVWSDLENLIPFSEKEFGDVPDVYAANAGILEPVTCSLRLELYCIAALTLMTNRNGLIFGPIRRMINMLHLKST